MKKLMLMVAGVLVSTVAMAHVVMHFYITERFDYGSYVEEVNNEVSFFLDDIERIDLFSSSDNEEHPGESGVRLLLKNGGTYDYFSSQVDSIVWHDLVDPGFGDFSCNMDSYEAVLAQMNTLYRSLNSFADLQNSDWGYRPQLLFNGHPTLDTQATGWDSYFCNQRYNDETSEFAYYWEVCYRNIFRCNQTIQALQTTTAADAETLTQLIAEARTIRAFFYIQLATCFGRVVIFDTGEDHANCGTNRVRAENYQAMWDYIIADLSFAADILDWQPRIGIHTSGINGTMTRGIALTYLGDAYMWKAYRCPELAGECYSLAADVLGKVIEEGPYRLNESYTTLWDPIPLNASTDFNREAIYVQVLEDASWGMDAPQIFTKFYTASPETGGWGSLYLSWEWYAAFEQGDKRRDASCVIGNVPADQMDAYGLGYSMVNHGTHPYLKTPVGNEGMVSHFKSMGEPMPQVWSMKWWRNSKADWMSNPFAATNIYWKRLSNVMLDYAECLFNLDRDGEAWDIIDQLRQRAFGNLEVGHASEIADKYLPEMNKIFMRNHYFSHDTYPMPFNETVVDVPDARSYYTELKEQKGFESPVWKVAVNEERRKEFNAECCLRPDMERSGYLQDHIEHNYPRSNAGQSNDVDYPWTIRNFSFDPDKMLFPIPISELRRNADCDQNPGY